MKVKMCDVESLSLLPPGRKIESKGKGGGGKSETGLTQSREKKREMFENRWKSGNQDWEPRPEEQLHTRDLYRTTLRLLRYLKVIVNLYGTEENQV